MQHVKVLVCSVML